MADLERAAAALTVVAANAGQVCTATTCLIAEASVHDELVERVVERGSKLKPGVDFGPIITEAQYATVLKHFETAKADGAIPAIGGEAYPESEVGKGMFIKPTVYANVDPRWRIAHEELFGPVLVTMPCVMSR